MPLAWSYQRTSTTRQAGADKSGMDRQEAALAQWLADHPDYQLAEALVDAGVSGGKGKNRTKGALARFIQGGRDGTVPPGSCLVVESLSRFSREVATATLRTLLNDVWGQNLSVAFCAYGGEVLTGDLIDRESHRLHAILGSIQQARAEYEERQRRSRGACAKRRQLQDQGATPPGRIPWWLTRSPSGEIELDPINTDTVRRLVALTIAGNGQNILARTAQQEGRPNPKGGQTWTPEQARNTVDHPALSGDLVRKDKTVHGYYPAAITRAEHEQLRQALALLAEKYASTGKRVSGKNLFQGLAFCHHCGGPIGRQRPNPNGRADHQGYVRCSRAARGLTDADGNPCPGGSAGILIEDWEPHVITRLSTAVWSELLRRPDDESRLHDLRQREHDLMQAAARDAERLAQLEQRAEDTWASGADDELIATANRAVAKAREKAAASKRSADEVQQEIAVLTAMPQAGEVAAELEDRISTFMRGLADATPEQRVEFNRWLCARRPVIRLELDVATRQVGLRVGDGPIDWAPLAGAARRAALAAGEMDPHVAVDVGDRFTVLTQAGRILGNNVVPETPEQIEQFKAGARQAVNDLLGGDHQFNAAEIEALVDEVLAQQP